MSERKTSDGRTLTAPQVAALEAIEGRLRWPSLHWGVESVDADAWPHLASAAADAALTAQPAISAERVEQASESERDVLLALLREQGVDERQTDDVVIRTATLLADAILAKGFRRQPAISAEQAKTMVKTVARELTVSDGHALVVLAQAWSDAGLTVAGESDG